MVRVEVKSFNLNGRAIFTNRELRKAAEEKDDYFLIGILDDSKPPRKWRTYKTQNPIMRLLTLGEFIMDTRLQIPAAILFELDEERGKDR